MRNLFVHTFTYVYLQTHTWSRLAGTFWNIFFSQLIFLIRFFINCTQLFHKTHTGQTQSKSIENIGFTCCFFHSSTINFGGTRNHLSFWFNLGPPLSEWPFCPSNANNKWPLLLFSLNKELESLHTCVCFPKYRRLVMRLEIFRLSWKYIVFILNLQMVCIFWSYPILHIVSLS